jgi:hypothetical protein
MILKKLDWYANRLRCMSVDEMRQRTFRMARIQFQRMGYLTAKVVPRPQIEQHFNRWIEGVDGIDPAPYCHAADRILAGKVDLLSFKSIELGDVPNWTRNIITGEQAPLSFGMTLDYRDAGIVGDIKYIWVPNRHLQFVTLAQAYFLSENGKYLDGIARQLRAWIEQSPYLLGPNWTSSLELALRLINWSLVWQLIGGAHSPMFRDDRGIELRDSWLEVIYQHCHFIRGHFSHHSSANNHLIGEAAGLFVATTTWPFWKQFRKWQHTAKDVLTREMLLQNAKDGVNREQAIFYAQFVLDFFLTAALVGRSNGIEFPKECWHRFEAMLEYIATLMDVGDNVPMIGDADDGYVVQLSQGKPFCPFKSLLATGAVLCSRAEFKHKAGRLDDKTRWLIGADSDKRFDDIRTEAVQFPVRCEFPKGGYYILGKDFESSREVRLIMDAGPLGYPSIAAHGHADALAVILSVAGKEFLIDPGTYAYQSNVEWRNYFRGTAAHNTVRIDQQDQSVIGGKFMWLRKANAVVETWETDEHRDRIVAHHDGYRRMADPVSHRREVVFDKVGMHIHIADTIDCEKTHIVERCWHFSEKCEITRDGDGVVVVNDGVRVRLRSKGDDSKITLYRGQNNPPLGWISRHFDIKEPTTTVVFKNKTGGLSTLKTDISIGSLP